jgi:hypothetical protein
VKQAFRRSVRWLCGCPGGFREIPKSAFVETAAACTGGQCGGYAAPEGSFEPVGRDTKCCVFAVGNTKNAIGFRANRLLVGVRVFPTKERHHGKEDKKESETEEEEVILRHGVNLALTPIGLVTLRATLAAGYVRPPFVYFYRAAGPSHLQTGVRRRIDRKVLIRRVRRVSATLRGG